MLYGDILDEISFKELESSWSMLFYLFLSELCVEATTVTDGVESLSNTNTTMVQGFARRIPTSDAGKARLNLVEPVRQFRDFIF